MKVYRSIRSTSSTLGSVVINRGKGWFFCEDGDNYKNKSYSVKKADVENNPLIYEFVCESDMTPDYYIQPLYTQFDMDNAVKK